MSDTSNDGGPAFPRAAGVRTGESCASQRGMSLRDWFAGQAMAAMLTCYRDKRVADDDGEPRGRHTTMFWRDMGLDINRQTGESDGGSEIAGDAYVIADAMLAERAKGGAS